MTWLYYKSVTNRIWFLCSELNNTYTTKDYVYSGFLGAIYLLSFSILKNYSKYFSGTMTTYFFCIESATVNLFGFFLSLGVVQNQMFSKKN